MYSNFVKFCKMFFSISCFNGAFFSTCVNWRTFILSSRFLKKKSNLTRNLSHWKLKVGVSVLNYEYTCSKVHETHTELLRTFLANCLIPEYTQNVQFRRQKDVHFSFISFSYSCDILTHISNCKVFHRNCRSGTCLFSFFIVSW